MTKLKFTGKVGALLTGIFTLAGCEDYFPSQSVTDVYAQNILIETQDDSSLVNTYQIMMILS